MVALKQKEAKTKEDRGRVVFSRGYSQGMLLILNVNLFFLQFFYFCTFVALCFWEETDEEKRKKKTKRKKEKILLLSP